MYRKQDRNQLSLEDFIMPFGGKLRADNRWVKLAAIMPWDFIEDVYAESMSENDGAPAIASRIAFGALYIKENENLVDRRTVEYITENPYMQYFLGLQEFTDEPLFNASMMVHFRKRFPAEKIEEINRMIIAAMKNTDDDDSGEPPSNKGKLVLDATCAPADIRYPSDLSLLGEARENTEEIIEELWEHSQKRGHKTKYNRRKARSKYLRIAKQKKPKTKRLRAAVGEQLDYVTSNIEVIGELLLQTGLDTLQEKRLTRLMTICELVRQQRKMYTNNTRSVENRIVSLRQPHIRPIVRGKAGVKYEFGQKLAFSVVDGYTFIEKQSFDNFNEGVTLIDSVERYRQTHGYYPEVVQADQIYRNRVNLAYCKERGIRLSGPRLGRPGRDSDADRETQYRDLCERNIIEGRNGMAKRRFGLDLIMAYLPETALTEAAFAVLCMNAHLRILLRLLFHRRFFATRFAIA
jgi:hypothetical protein